MEYNVNFNTPESQQKYVYLSGCYCKCRAVCYKKAIGTPFVYMPALYEHIMAYLSCLRPNFSDSYICKGRVIVHLMLSPQHTQSSELM